MTTDIISIGNNSNNNNSNIIIGNFGNDYFKLGSLTRRHSVIGCIGFEFANPSTQLFEEDKEKEKYKQQQEDKEKEENSCAICLEQQKREQTKNLATTPCGHTFCLTCLLSHLKHNNSCPLCRAPIEENEKKIVTPISYDDGVMLLNYELTSLRIEENIQEQIDALIEISSGNSQTNGANISSVADELMTMVASFGFNLLYDALCHMHNGEENVDPEWQHEMYGSDSESDDYSGHDEDSEDSGGDDDDESEGNLTTISSSDDDDDTQKEGSWGNMYQLPPINID